MNRRGLTLTYERARWREGFEYVIGMDEVGRGSLAGPVLVGAVALSRKAKWVRGVNDSKKLTRLQREIVAKKLLSSGLGWAWAASSAKQIDRLGIEGAIGKAMAKAYQKLARSGWVVVDGPRIPGMVNPPLGWTTQIRGDGHIYAIAAASILAKITRDRWMSRLHNSHINYDWIHNQGYGTRIHLQAIKQWNLTAHHRRSFCQI